MGDRAFVTIDPPGARDLDQALHIERRGGGHRVSYAIADVAAFVTPGDAADAFAFQQGVTLYHPGVPEAAGEPGAIEGRKRLPEVGPQRSLQEPLYPDIVERASLLPDQERPAVVWTIDLDGRGEPTAVDVRRETVRSTAQYTYEDVPDPVRSLLGEVGERRLARERERGGVSLPTPEQEVDEDGRLHYRAPLDTENWNAQISLLTGMIAADEMLRGGTGLLRTLPPAEPEAIARFRRVTEALERPWPAEQDYGEYIRGLDPFTDREAAILRAATRVLRGAGYVAFEDGHLPPEAGHAALAMEYAHVTAPLRRLADRFATECALAAHAGTPVPDWVRDRLADLPAVMEGAGRRAAEIERAAVDRAEARALAGRVGETFEAVVIADGTVQLRDPAVRAPVDGEPPLGATIRARLVTADPEAGTVRFSAGG